MKIVWLLTLLCLLSCTQDESKYKNQRIDVQGNRGARGLYPENSLIGFKAALDLGISTLEMDVCMTMDAVVIVSHEPWMNADICILPNGDRIAKANESDYNIYEMPYDAVKNYDCGSIGNPAFPKQKRVVAHKLSLEETVTQLDAYAKAAELPMPYYSIEIKRIKGYDEVYHPNFDFFAQSVMHELQKLGIEERTIIQSFDVQTLEYIHDKYSDQLLSFKVGSEDGVDKNLKKIKFVPTIYSPKYTALNKGDVALLRKKHVKIIPWTVNEIDDMKAMLDLGVDGIITDYPDRLMNLVSE